MLYDMRQIVKDCRDDERGNMLLPLFFLISKAFCMIITKTGWSIPQPFDIPVMEHWPEQEIAQ